MTCETSQAIFSRAQASAATVALAYSADSLTSHSPSIPNQNKGIAMGNSHGPYARKIRGECRNVLGNRDVALKLRDVSDATYDGDASKAKAAAKDANSSPRAAENWFAADNPMSLTAFLNAYHANPTFKAWARKILFMEEELDPAFQAQLAAFISAVRAAP